MESRKKDQRSLTRHSCDNAAECLRHCKPQNLNKIMIYNDKAGEMHAI